MADLRETIDHRQFTSWRIQCSLKTTISAYDLFAKAWFTRGHKYKDKTKGKTKE